MMRFTWVRTAWQRLIGDTVLVRLIPTWQAGRPLSKPHDYTAFAEDAYRRNALVSACVWEIATSAAEPALKVQRRQHDGSLKDVESDHPLARLLEKPNIFQSQYEFLEQFHTHQQVTGNAYIRKIRAATGLLPVQLALLRPDRTTIVPDANGFVKQYDYQLGGQTKHFLAADVIHVPLHPDIVEEYYGLSPIAVLARAIDTDNEAWDYLRAFFQNNAVPAGAIKTKAMIPDPDERQRIKEQWRTEHTGKQGWWSIAIFDADSEYQDIGVSPDKLRLQHIWSQTESRICAGYGIPASVVGALIGLNPTYANYKEGRRSLWEETLRPLYQRIGQALTRGLAPDFGDDLVISFDLSMIGALQENLEAVRTHATRSWSAGLITRNEARRLMGLPAIVGGDIYKIESSAMAAAERLPILLDAMRSGLENQRQEISGMIDGGLKTIATQNDSYRRFVEALAEQQRDMIRRVDHLGQIATLSAPKPAAPPIVVPVPVPSPPQPILVEMKLQRVRHTVERDASGRMTALVETFEPNPVLVDTADP